MYSYQIRNIVHRITGDPKDINIIYYPHLDIVDDFITNWDVGFYLDVKADIGLRKHNIFYGYSLSLFEYDFLLIHQLSQQAHQIAIDLHIPIIQYLNYGFYDPKQIPKHNNIFYIAETDVPIDREDVCTMFPTTDISTQDSKKDKHDIAIIADVVQNLQFIELLESKIDNHKILKLPINQKDSGVLAQILSDKKLCIEPFPKSIHTMLICASMNLPYLTTRSMTTEYFKNIYSGVFYLESNLQNIINQCNNLLSLSNRFDYKKTNNDIQKLYSFLQKIKRTGMIL